MTALEANNIAQQRSQFGLLIDAIEKEARKGNFELNVNSIDIGECSYYPSEEEFKWLKSNGYHVYIEDALCDFDPDTIIVSWSL